MSEKIDLKQLEKNIDEALDKETPESLKEWLDSKRQKTLSPETIEVIREELRITQIYLIATKHKDNEAKAEYEKILKAQQEFNAVYGGGE
jgi:Ni,Fe-hydrogenase III component G